MTPFLALLRRDLKLAFREGSALGTALGFYLIVVAILPLGLGPDLNLLSRIAPGVLWVALLLAALLTLPRMYETDDEDGSLDLLAMGSVPLELIAVAKSLAHWLSTALPLSLMAPVAGILLNLDLRAYPVLIASLLVGTPAISFIGGICAALTLRARRGGLLVALLVLPFYVPTLIFGMSAVDPARPSNGPLDPSFLLLTAISLVSMVIGPLGTAAALRAQLR